MNMWLMLAAQMAELILTAPDQPTKYEFKSEPASVTIPPLPKLPDLPKFEFPAMPVAVGASVPIPAPQAVPLLAQGEAKHGEGTCIPCTNDHWSVICGYLGEALRFGRRSGVEDPEVLSRVIKAEDEINVWERIDASPAQVSALPQEKREIIYWVLRGSKSVRDQLKTIKTVDDLERVAGEACELRLRFRLKAQGIPEDKAMGVLQKVVNGTLTPEQGKAELKGLRPT